MSYSISSDLGMTEQGLPLPGSLSRLPSFMAEAARRRSAAGADPDGDVQSGPQAAGNSARQDEDSARFSSASAKEAANAANQAQEDAYLAMGRASKRGSGQTNAPSAGEDALPGAATAMAAAERGQSGEGAPRLVPGQNAASPLTGASASKLLPGESASSNEQRPASSSETGGSQRATVSGADEARSPERSFMGGQASAAGLGQDQGPANAADEKSGGITGKNGAKNDGQEDEASGPASEQLSEEEEAKVEDMQKRDREVRSHEQAHIAAGGNLVSGGASYETETGPDGKAYAVGGEVQIDTSEGSTPEATITKAQRIKSAALAPAEPSGQDRAVAAQASQMEAAARTEKREQDQEEKGEENEDGVKGLAGQDQSRDQGGEDADKGIKGLAGLSRDQEQKPETESPGARSSGSGRLSAAVSAYERASGVQPPAAFGYSRSFAV